MGEKWFYLFSRVHHKWCLAKHTLLIIFTKTRWKFWIRHYLNSPLFQFAIVSICPYSEPNLNIFFISLRRIFMYFSLQFSNDFRWNFQMKSDTFVLILISVCCIIALFVWGQLNIYDGNLWGGMFSENIFRPIFSAVKL